MSFPSASESTSTYLVKVLGQVNVGKKADILGVYNSSATVFEECVAPQAASSELRVITVAGRELADSRPGSPQGQREDTTGEEGVKSRGDARGASRMVINCPGYKHV